MKKIFLRNFFSLLFLSILSFSCFAGENKTVRIVCSIMDTSGTGYKSGYSYEYFQRISYLTGWKYEYVYTDFSTALQMLKDGKVDIKDNLSYTDERAEFIAYPDYPQGQEIYYLYTSENDSGELLKNLANINGKKIAVSKGSFQETVFKNWILQHEFDVEIVETSGSAAAFEALKNNEVSGMVYPGTNDAAGYIPVANIGYSDFYFGVNKERPDLLAELNEALRKLQTANPSFNSDLYNKYQPFDINAQILSKEEREYILGIKSVTVGILDDYLPFSDETNGEISGVVSYLAECIKNMSSTPKDFHIYFKSYPTYNEMIQGLKNKEVNLIFPITSDFYYSEINEIRESEQIFELPMSLIYRDYNDKVTSKIAITKHSPSQRVYVANNYPESEMIEFNTPEECFDAVLNGEVPSTVFNSFRTEHFFNTTKYLTLNEISLPQHASMCFAVNKKDRLLLDILDKQIIKINKNELINRTYDFLKVMNTYTAEDFIREHRSFFFFGLLFVILTIISLLTFGIVRERKHKKELKLNLSIKTRHMMARLAIDEAMESGSWEMEFDNDGKFICCHWSDQFRRLLGYTNEKDFPDEIESWSKLIVPEDKEYSLKVLFSSATDTSGSKGYNLEHRLVTKNNGIRWFRAGGKAVKKIDNSGIIYYGAFQDIHENKLAQQKAYTDSIKDPLTGLNNRRAHDSFVAELEQNPQDFVCAISIDLNGLKTANDVLGHSAGDELICGAAACLKKVFKKIGKIYRMGGDEFEVLSTRSDVDFQEIIVELKKECESWHGEYAKELTMSVGFASEENVSAKELAQLIKKADEKMYEDKRNFYQQATRNRRTNRS